MENFNEFETTDESQKGQFENDKYSGLNSVLNKKIRRN